MEILFEIFGWILQIIGEILLQLFGEILVELGIRAMAAPFDKREFNPGLIATGYMLLGLIVGGLSLLAFPAHFIINPRLRLLNLILSPTIAGGLTSLWGSLRAQSDQPSATQRFLRGFLFALGMSLVRFHFTKN